MSGIVNPFPERSDGLPVVDSRTGRVIGTVFERKPRPTHIRLAGAFGCLQRFNGQTFPVLSWAEDGNPLIDLPGVDVDPAIYVTSSEWVPAEPPPA